MRPVSLLFALAVTTTLSAQPAGSSGVIQTAVLAREQPYFVPTHPRVTTTIRFPGEIGAPDGAVGIFTEDATKPGAEYVVAWQRGDAYLTLTPLRDGRMANLNVPYQGATFVVYVYTVPDPLQAVAVLNLVEAAGAAVSTVPGPVQAGQTNDSVRRTAERPAVEQVLATPARLLGFMDRLKLLHATPAGARLVALAQAMGVEVAMPADTAGTLAADSLRRGVVERCGGGLTDAGLYQIVLLRAVRDPRLNAIGFICLLRNTSPVVLNFDVGSFGARAGAEYLGQRLSDAPAVVKPNEQVPAYFVVQPPAGSPLLATNDWKVTVELVNPRPNPGAALARGFAGPSVTR